MSKKFNKVYIASRLANHIWADKFAKMCRNAGLDVLSDWHENCANIDITADAEAAEAEVADNLAAIDRADKFIFLSDTHYGRGPADVEFGYAFAVGCELAIIGPPRNIYHQHPVVEQFENIDEFMVFLRESTED